MHYCQCETPVMDIDHDAGCRRCGLPVDFTPPRYFVLFTPVGWAVNDRELGREYLLFGLGAEGYRLATESAAELNDPEPMSTGPKS